MLELDKYNESGGELVRLGGLVVGGCWFRFQGI